MIAVSRLAMMFAWCAVGCQPVAMSPTTTAVVALTSTVGAAAVNRAITGGCYAMCSKDYHCDHNDGLCHPNTSVDRNKPALSAQTPETPVASEEPSSEVPAPATSADSATTNRTPADPVLTVASPLGAKSEEIGEAERPSCRPPFRCALTQTAKPFKANSTGQGVPK